MPKSGLTEWMLKRAAGTGRGTAIYGDLVELAAARGTTWFWMAYARTLISLTWRVVAALVVAMSLYQLLGNTLFHRVHGPSGPYPPTFLIFWFGPWFLWFVLPFAAVLYGVRDCFVQFTAIAALGTTIEFLFLPRFSLLGVIVALTLAAFAVLFSGSWRQGAVLAATLAFAHWSGMAVGMSSMFLLSHGYVSAYGHGITGVEPMLAFRGSIVASAYLCVRMHRWLLEPRRTGATHA